MMENAQSAPFLIRSALLAALVGGSGLAFALDIEDSGGPEKLITPDDSEWTVTLDLGASFISEADFDTTAGTIESTSFGAELGILIPVGDRARLLLSFGADVTEYDITPAVGAVGTTAGTVGTQFDTVTEYGFDGLYTRAIDGDTSFFVGGGIGVAAEGGASDAIVWNGVGGFSFKVTPKLRLGMGVGVFSQIEDDVRIVPLPQVHYTIDDRWSIQSKGVGGKIEYKWSDELSMGVLGQFDGRSFRIDGDNTLVPDGAVTMTGFPISYYLDYSGGEVGGTSNISIFAQVGVVVAGSMEILDSTGTTVVDEDIDPGVFAGVGLKIEF